MPPAKKPPKPEAPPPRRKKSKLTTAGSPGYWSSTPPTPDEVLAHALAHPYRSLEADDDESNVGLWMVRDEFGHGLMELGFTPDGTPWAWSRHVAAFHSERSLADLAKRVQAWMPLSAEGLPLPSGATLAETGRAAQRGVLLATLRKQGWNLTATAKALGLAGPSNVIRSLKTLGLTGEYEAAKARGDIAPGRPT